MPRRSNSSRDSGFKDAVSKVGGEHYERDVTIGPIRVLHDEGVVGGRRATSKSRGSQQSRGKLYDYARAEEFGTREEGAHPFFFNTYRAMVGGLKNSVKKAALDSQR